MRVALVGAGKMGLPLACQLAHKGATVAACDKNAALVEAINAGRCPFDEPGLAPLLEEGVRSGRLRATTDTASAVASSEVVVVIVPALLTSEKDVDASILVAASRDIAKGLKKGTLVSYETTLPVGGTRRLLVPVLAASGLEPGRDFDVCFSPERVKSQYVLRHLTQTTKVVGGITPAAAERGCAFYSRYVGAPVENVGVLEAAELVKIAGMVYRDVNIALANELARYAEAVGVDFPSLIPTINSDGEAKVLLPGIGVGGHCTPVYPYFLIRDAERRGSPVTLADQSRRVNDGQARHALERLERAWGPVRGKRVLLLGLAFRPLVKEDAFSTAYLLREALLEKGALVSLHDPLYSADEIRAHGFEPGSLDGERAPQALVLVTDHPELRSLDWASLRARGLEAVLDGRNLWSPSAVRSAGLRYSAVGKPDAR